jgi:hypothetical protein
LIHDGSASIRNYCEAKVETNCRIAPRLVKFALWKKQALQRHVRLVLTGKALSQLRENATVTLPSRLFSMWKMVSNSNRIFRSPRLRTGVEISPKNEPLFGEIEPQYGLLKLLKKIKPANFLR